MKKFTALCTVGALLVLSLPGCAYLSKEGRDRMTYERYVKKQSKSRKMQRAKLFRSAPAIPQPTPSDWVVTTQAGDGPMSASSE